MAEERFGIIAEIDPKHALIGGKKYTAAVSAMIKKNAEAIDSAKDMGDSLKFMDNIRKQHIASMKKQNVTYKEMAGVLRITEAEVRRLAGTEQTAAQATKQATVTVTQHAAAVRRAEAAQRRYRKSVTRTVKKMLLWAIGARTVYTIVNKIRRALMGAARDIYGNTVEYEGLKAAYDNFAHSLILGLISQEDALELMRHTADAIDTLSQAFITYRAELDGTSAALDQLISKQGTWLQRLMETAKKIPSIAWGMKLAANLGVLGEELGILPDTLGLAEAKTSAFDRSLAKSSQTLKDMAADTSAAEAALKKYNATLWSLTERYAQDLVDRAIDAEHDRIDAGVERARRLEDIERESGQRLVEIHETYIQKIASAERNYRRQMQDAAYNHARRMVDIEFAYRTQLRQIERSFAETIWDAISARDATAALRAIRKRRQDLADARRGRDKQRSDANADYAKQVSDLRDALNEQRRLASEYRQEQIEQQRANDAEQEAEYQRSLKRQEEDQARHDTWSLQALTDRYKQERSIAAANYRHSENAYAAHLARMAIIRGGGYGGTSYAGGFAQGGAFVATGPTTALFGEGGSPELVVAIPLNTGAAPSFPSSMRHQIAGTMRHEVGGEIRAQMANMTGQLTAAVTQGVRKEIMEIIR